MREQIYRYRVEYLKEGETRDVLVKEHEELTKAIRERDVERAKQLSFQHIENQRMAIMRSIEAEDAERERAEKENSKRGGMPLFFCASMYVSGFRNIADWQQICLVHRKRCTGMKRGGKLLKKLEESRKVSANLRENEKYLRSRLENCSDILIRPMRLGDKHKVDCLMVYIEVAVSNMMLDDSALGKMINHFWEISPEDIQEFVRHNSLGIADVKKLENLDESIDAMLAGNAVFFIDGYDKAMKISSKGYPSTGVMEAESEKVLRGSREGFSDSVKSNSALIRKRLRDTRLKVEEYKIGVRSHTLTQVLYMDDLVHEGLLEEVKERLEEFQIDGILDSGMLEQLTEDVWYSPFPQYQTTERPDRAVQEILKGKVVILCDNSPEALILPGNFSSFMESSEDWYHRFEMASFLRILRYLAVIMATVLPGLYLAVIRFHTQILPSALILSFAEAREGVPFSSVVELIFLELAFELIREAGVRVPGSLGNAIGIVGGLVIGQAAANLVSPIVVMIVALTALGSMTVPNEEFAAAFRLVKYGFLILGGYLGIYGIVLGVYLVIGHLAGLISFGIPYLVPFIKKEQKGSRGEGVLRVPLRKRVLRPLYAREEQKIRLKRKESGS